LISWERAAPVALGLMSANGVARSYEVLLSIHAA